MMTKEEMPACPVATTVQLIGSKWKLLILRNLMMRAWRFNEMRRDLEGVSQKVLTDSLRALEEDGIITRTVYPEVPPRVEYALSPLGESMRPILEAMEAWGKGYRRRCWKRGSKGFRKRRGFCFPTAAHGAGCCRKTRQKLVSVPEAPAALAFPCGLWYPE